MTMLQTSKRSTDNTVPRPLSILREQTEAKYQFSMQTAVHIGQSMTPIIGYRNSHSFYLARLYSGAELPFPLTLRCKGGSSATSLTQEPFSVSPLLPRNVAERLLQVYTERILPQCPIFYPHELRAIYNRLYSRDAPSGSTIKGDTFIVAMAMAVATLTSKSKAYRKVAELAEALRMEALRSDTNGQFLATTSIRSLQGLLLLAQYGLLMPSVVDLWYTASEAMRVAVELGLHRDPPEVMGMSQEVIHGRCRLFWATYSMGRAVTLTCHRPFALRDDQIRLAVVPSARLDTPVLACSNHAGEVRRYLTHLAYCKLRTEISCINISNEPIDPPAWTYTEWVASCEQRIEELRVAGADWADAILIPDWHDIPALRCLAWLYMPCPRNPCPSDATMAKFVKTLMCILETYWAMAQRQTINLCWYVVHHAYEVGTQMLYCMQNCPSVVQAEYSKTEVVDALTHLSEFFVKMEDRWPAASQCKLLVEKLSSNILAAFLRDQGPLNAVTETPSDEQRVVDVIFRKNGFFFLAGEEALDMQSYLAGSFTDPILHLDLDVSSASSANTLLATFDLGSGTFMPSDPGGDCMLDWFSGMQTRDNNNEITVSGAFPLASLPSKPLELSSSMQHLVDLSRQNLEKLPVCTFCRSKRIRCSRNLPSCHNCIDFQRPCQYVESSTGLLVAGKYLDEMRQVLGSRLKALEAAQMIAASRAGAECMQTAAKGQQCRGPKTMLLEYDTPFGVSACYWGESSILGTLLSTPLPALCKREMSWKAKLVFPNLQRPQPMIPILRSLEEIPPEFLSMLVRRYLGVVETFLPILGKQQLSELVESLHTGTLGEHDDDAAATSGRALLHLVVAIGLALPFGERMTTLAMAQRYFDGGMALAARATKSSYFVASTIESLQFALLACVYVRLDLAAGRLPRLVSAASRICLDLLESQDLTEGEMATLHVLFRTAYVLDTDAAVDFGRPNYLPEWKTSGKMMDHATASDDRGRIALLVYNASKLRATIHIVATNGSNSYHKLDNTNTLSVSSSSSTSTSSSNHATDLLTTSLAITLRAQLDDWLDEWTRETAAAALQCIGGHGPVHNLDLAHSYQNTLFHYGTFVYFQTVSLIRLLEEVQGNDEDCVRTLSHAEALISSQAAFHNIDPVRLDAPVVDYGFPICWSHYKDIFSAGLELLSPKVSKVKALENCYGLLRLFEACIGTREWTLSEQLLILMQA